MQESRRNEVSADGMERIKSSQKDKCGWKTKVGRGDCPKSQTFLSENRKSASGLVGGRSISVSQGLFGRPGGKKNKSRQ